MDVDIVARPEPEVKQPQGVSEARQQGETPMGMPPRVGVDADESPRVLAALPLVAEGCAKGKQLEANRSLDGWTCRCRRCVDFKLYSPGGP